MEVAKHFVHISAQFFRKIENLFLVIFLLFGFLFVFIIPPGWNTDEPDHTYRIAQLASADLLSEPVTSPYGNRAFGGQVPQSLVGFYTELGVRDAGANAINTGQRINDLYVTHPQIKGFEYSGKTTAINFSGAALYSPVTYAPYLPSFIIGKQFSISLYHTILIARICGLLFVAAILYISIKKILFGKWIIFAVGLLPIVLVQATTIGADGPAIAVAILFLTVFVNTIFKRKKVTIRQYLLLMAIGIILALIKIGYTPLVGLIFFIPFITNDYKSIRNVGIATGATVFAVLPAFLWSRAVSYIDTNSNLQANFPLQESFILHQPLIYIKTLFYTFFSDVQSPMHNLFGTSVWASASLPDILAYLAVAILVVSALVTSSRDIHVEHFFKKFPLFWRIGLLVLSVFTAIFISTILYIYSSSLKQSSISGIQARYFIPLIPFVLIALYGNTLRRQKGPKWFIVISSIVMLLGMLFVVYHRLYQNLPTILG